MKDRVYGLHAVRTYHKYRHFSPSDLLIIEKTQGDTFALFTEIEQMKDLFHYYGYPEWLGGWIWDLNNSGPRAV